MCYAQFLPLLYGFIFHCKEFTHGCIEKYKFVVTDYEEMFEMCIIFSRKSTRLRKIIVKNIACASISYNIM